MLVRTNLVHRGQFSSLPQTVAPLLAPPVPAVTYNLPVPAQAAPQQNGISFGTVLAAGVSLWGASVMLDPKASREQKAIAQAVLGVVLPYALKPVFEVQAWPAQWN